MGPFYSGHLGTIKVSHYNMLHLNVLNTEVSSFQGIQMFSILISVEWNRGVPLYTEVSSFQGVGIEGSTVYSEVSSFQEVGIEGFHCIFKGVLISGGWDRGVPLYIQRCPHFRRLE